MTRHGRTPRSACLGIALTIFIGLAIAAPSAAHEEKRYDPGASDTTIKIGNTAPYCGPLSSNSANIFVNFASAKFAAQAIRKAAEVGWKPVHILQKTRSRSAPS
jgi:hypothetical protein